MRKIKLKVDYDVLRALLNITIHGLNAPFIDNQEEKFKQSVKADLFVMLSKKSVALNLKNLTLKYHEAYLLHEAIGSISNELEVSNYTSRKVLNFYAELDQFLTQNLQIR